MILLPPPRLTLASLLILLALPNPSYSTSAAEGIYHCDADYPKYGCSKWDTMLTYVCPPQGSEMLLRPCAYVETDNRGACLDEPASETIMGWARAPTFSSAYSLHAGNGTMANDLTSYMPEKWMDITLSVHQYNKKYRGLLLHANDANKNKVGEWGLPESKEADFWHPTSCGTQVSGGGGCHGCQVWLRIR